MDTPLRGPVALVCCAVKLQLPGRTLRLLDGSAALTVNGEMYVGEDPDFGALGAVEAVSDALGNEAPTLRLQLLTKTNTAMAEVAAPGAQGSPLTLWYGVVDPVTTVVTTGDPIFVGERLFEANEGTRLTDAFWTTAYADDPSFEFTPNIPQESPWGADRARPVYSGSGGGVSNPGWGGGFGVGGFNAPMISPV
jgi:hypothetical protein